MSLRQSLTKLAHEVPTLRKHLVPLLRGAAVLGDGRYVVAYKEAMEASLAAMKMGWKLKDIEHWDADRQIAFVDAVLKAHETAVVLAQKALGELSKLQGSVFYEGHRHSQDKRVLEESLHQHDVRAKGYKKRLYVFLHQDSEANPYPSGRWWKW